MKPAVALAIAFAIVLVIVAAMRANLFGDTPQPLELSCL